MRHEFPKGIRRVQRPKMNNHGGRTWDRCTVTLPGGSTIEGHYDTTWGSRFYFESDGVWYAGSIADFDSGESRLLITPDLRRPAQQEGK